MFLSWGKCQIFCNYLCFNSEKSIFLDIFFRWDLKKMWFWNTEDIFSYVKWQHIYQRYVMLFKKKYYVENSITRFSLNQADINTVLCFSSKNNYILSYHDFISEVTNSLAIFTSDQVVSKSEDRDRSKIYLSWFNDLMQIIYLVQGGCKLQKIFEF